jgi:purine-nucleoside phosphorylase
MNSAEFISSRFKDVYHDIAIVLGSGLGGLTKDLSDKIVLKTNEIPDYPRSTVPGHTGEIISAKLANKRVLIFSGRVHYYETESTIDAAVTAIVSHRLGIERIVLTNAAGILNEKFSPGDLMVIKDQINLTFRSVLLDLKMPTKDLNPIYSELLAAKAFLAAERSGTDLKSGVYLGLTGPSYETAAEVGFYRRFGCDAAGMSTIQEATFARSVGMEVAGISCLTNYSTGMTSEKLSHDEVTKVGAKVDERFSRLLTTFVEMI